MTFHGSAPVVGAFLGADGVQSMYLGEDKVFESGGGGPAPWQQLLTLAAAAGATAVYDPDNPNTWTLRTDGGSSYYTEIRDGLGNLAALQQATDSKQFLQATLSTGRKVAQSGTETRMVASFTTIAQPVTHVQVLRAQGGASLRYLDSESSGAHLVGKGTLATRINMFAGTNFNVDSALTTNWQLVHTILDGASSYVLPDAGSPTTGSAGTTSLNNGLTWGSTRVDAAWWDGFLGPLILFNSRKEAGDISALRALLLNTDIWPIGSTG